MLLEKWPWDLSAISGLRESSHSGGCRTRGRVERRVSVKSNTLHVKRGEKDGLARTQAQALHHPQLHPGTVANLLPVQHALSTSWSVR